MENERPVISESAKVMRVKNGRGAGPSEAVESQDGQMQRVALGWVPSLLRTFWTSDKTEMGLQVKGHSL